MEFNFEKIEALVTQYGLRFLGALAVLIIGWIIIKYLSKGFGRLLTKRKIDESLVPFLKSLVDSVLKVLLIVSAMGMAGIEMTSFVAIIGAAGLAIGLALSGTLQNFAGGVIILLLKPFKVGDFIDAQGFMGSVRAINVFNTVLKTPDNKTIIIPNGGLSTASLTNFSAEPLRRVDWTFSISYGDSYETAKQVILDLINADSRILKEPAEPFIALHALADSSVNIVVRVWVNIADYWGVFFDMNEAVYNTFPQKGLNIPLPQMDIHLNQK